MISRKDCIKELPKVDTVEKSESNKFIWNSIYKCCYMCVRLLLDIRSNQMKEQTNEQARKS